MGVNILVVRKNAALNEQLISEQDDHKYLGLYLDTLDEMAVSIGVKPLSDFLDASDFEYDFYEELHGEPLPEDAEIETNPEWFSPAEAMDSVTKIIDFLSRDTDMKPPYTTGVLEDLTDCLAHLKILEKEQDAFHFIVLI